MKSKNRKRLINVWKIARISQKAALGIWIILFIFLFGDVYSHSLNEVTNMTALHYVLLIFVTLYASTIIALLYVGIPLCLIGFICAILMEFFKKKIRLKENVFTQIKLKNLKKSSIEEKINLALLYSKKNVIMLAKPEGNKILIKCIKDEKEIFSLTVYEDDFYYNDRIEYNF